MSDDDYCYDDDEYLDFDDIPFNEAVRQAHPLYQCSLPLFS